MGDSSTLQIMSGGTANWTASSPIFFQGTATIQNAGTFNAQTDVQMISNGSSANPAFVNSGTFRKTAGPGSETTIQVPFQSTGTVRVDTGALNLGNAFSNYNPATDTLTGGTYVVAGTLRFADANIVTNAASIVLDGAGSAIRSDTDADALAGFATNQSAGDFELKNGKNVTTTGAFSNAGDVKIGSASRFTASGNYAQTAGTTTLAASTAELQVLSGQVQTSGGTLSGTGTVRGPLNNTGGTVSPGLSAGILKVVGSTRRRRVECSTWRSAGRPPGAATISST